MGLFFINKDFRTVIVILWWSESPVSIILLFWKPFLLFVNKTSIELGFKGLLKQVGSFMRLVRLKVSQNIPNSVSVVSVKISEYKYVVIVSDVIIQYRDNITYKFRYVFLFWIITPK